jgi:hypothetical protein
VKEISQKILFPSDIIYFKFFELPDFLKKGILRVISYNTIRIANSSQTNNIIPITKQCKHSSLACGENNKNRFSKFKVSSKKKTIV